MGSVYPGVAAQSARLSLAACSLWSGCSLRPAGSPLAPAVLLSGVLAVHAFGVRYLVP